MFHRNMIDVMYVKYIIYYPGNFIFSSSVHSTYTAPYKINNHPMTGVSKRKPYQITSYGPSYNTKNPTYKIQYKIMMT